MVAGSTVCPAKHTKQGELGETGEGVDNGSGWLDRGGEDRHRRRDGEIGLKRVWIEVDF